MDETEAKKKPAFDLNIELVLVKNNAKRKIRVGANITFERLHKIIQAAYNWRESHPYQFLLFKNGDEGEKPSVEVVTDKEMAMNPKAAKLAHRAKLGEYLNEHKYLMYIYDFGDEWMHYIDVTDSLEDSRDDLPLLLEGENEAPPEDCGGPEGFEDFLKTIGKGRGGEYREMMEWAESQGWERYDFKRAKLRVWLAGNPGRGVWMKR